ncbi:aminotransferase class I/II-fold pyridoxal phosphate-dependent enzyme [bacterium]|nr:aminotransferase class I/II-fold pyridoxal phosphate-dependent enzyme [bacterium]
MEKVDMQNLTPYTKIGLLARTISRENNLTLREKAEIIFDLKQLQKDAGIYPYDRICTFGSSHRGQVSEKSRDHDLLEDLNATKPHVIWNLNHYLSLNRHPEVIQFAKECVDKYGTGSGTSVFSGGMNLLHQKIERFFCKLWKKEECLLFPTGYSANLGTISALAGPEDLIIIDGECHASVHDGIRLTRAKREMFDHNNIENLETILTRSSGDYRNTFLIVESVYSMSGDETKIKEICALKKTHGFFLYVDEAHSFGFYGKNGAGFCAEKGCLEQVDLLMTTLSKATASLGGVVACSKELAAYIQFRSNAYMFQACISPADAGAILKSLELLTTDEGYRTQLWNNTFTFRERLVNAGFDLKDSISPVIPIYVEDEIKLSHLCQELFEQGVFTNAIIYPAVALNEGRLRLIVTADHTEEDINRTVEVLKASAKKLEIL